MRSSRSSSLRFKLTLWFVLVFFLIQTLLIGGVVFFRRELIRKSLDASLSKSAENMVESILNSGEEWTEGNLRPLIPSGADFVLFALRDLDGATLAGWNLPEGVAPPFTQLEVVPAGPIGNVFSTAGPRLAESLTGRPDRLRLITVPLRHEGELYFFQAAVRNQALGDALGPFFDLVVTGIPVGVLAATIAAWLIAGRAVAPISRLSKAAREVSPTSLHERFSVPHADDEIARLESELNSALERLEAGYRAQDQFIGNVSHELRTPIAVLLTQAQVAKLGERTLEKSYAFIENAERVMKRLGKLVDSFLTLARADLTDALPDERLELADLVLECVLNCQTIAEQNQVRLVANVLVDNVNGGGDEPPEATLRGDSQLLQAMVENLVNNAVSHSPADGRVTIEAAIVRDTFRISVRDEGPGIPAAYLERIFDRFVQVPRDSGRRDGTGLGLAIANRIAQLHQGTIRVTNNEGPGCSFVVTLPIERAPAAPG